MPRQKKTLVELVQELEDTLTIRDLLEAVIYTRKEKTRLREKEKRARDRKKAERDAEPPADSPASK